MTPDRTLTINQLWRLVNRIEDAPTPAEIRKRCDIAAEWIKANETINNDEFDALMSAVAFIHRDSYHR